MATRDLVAFLEDGDLDYPLPSSAFDDPTKFPAGKTYTVPSPSARVGLWLTGIAELGIKARAGADLTAEDVAALRLDDDGERTLYQRVLGPVYDEMLTDGIKWTALQQVGKDAYLCFAMSPEAADGALSSLGKAPANRQQRRAVKRTAGRKSAQASTGTATPTRRRAASASSTSPNGRGAAAKTG